MSTSPAATKARLLERARAELPEPGDPRQLMEDLLSAGLSGPEALQVLLRTSLAHRQLRDLRLERAWSSGFGWFLARNLMLFGLLVLVAALTLAVPPLAVEGALAGAGLSYLLVVALVPLRMRHHGRRRDGILKAFGQDLGAYLDELAARKT